MAFRYLAMEDPLALISLQQTPKSLRGIFHPWSRPAHLALLTVLAPMAATLNLSPDNAMHLHCFNDVRWRGTLDQQRQGLS
jgi:hypothetical protein